MTPQDWNVLKSHGITPDNLTVGDWLDLSDTAITALPDKLTVGGGLDLSDTAITALPDKLTVGGGLDLTGSAITALLIDADRQYRLDRAGNSYIAGCRNFTAAQAIAHWGSADYPDPDRGAKYVAAVKAEEARRSSSASLSSAGARAMGETKFTRGEWRMSDPDEFGDFTIQGPDAELAIAAVCNGDMWRMGGKFEQHVANAHLLFAAPKLYEALDDMVKLAAQLGAIDLEMQDALAALALARGEK